MKVDIRWGTRYLAGMHTKKGCYSNAVAIRLAAMASIEILGDEAPFKKRFSVTPARHVKLGHMFFLFARIRFHAFATKCYYTIYHITSQQDYYHPYVVL